MDSIQIIVKIGVDADGNGGTVVDAPIAILPEGNAELIFNAFKDAYGVVSLEKNENNEPIPLSDARNFTYRVRLYIQEIFTAFAKKLKRQEAEAIADVQVQASLGSVVIK